MNSKQRASWSQAVAQHAASGQSEAEWCQVQEIKLSTFIYWRRRLSWSSTPSPATGFAEIQVKTPSVTRAPAKSRPAPLSPDAAVDSGVVLEAGPWRLRLHRDFDASSLARVLTVLQGQP